MPTDRTSALPGQTAIHDLIHILARAIARRHFAAQAAKSEVTAMNHADARTAQTFDSDSEPQR